ncbi:MAG: sigma-54 dependent transcriptional regulator [Pseudomonadota bacterium]
MSSQAGADCDLDDVDVAFIDGDLGLERMSDLAEGPLADAELFAMAAKDDTAFAEACIRAGFSFFFRKPFERASLTALLEDIAAEVAAQNKTADDLEDQDSMIQFGLMRGSSKGMRKLFRTLRKVGPTATTALIVGESGTGKELVAETLHQLSERSEGPYLTINCAAVADSLFESELFGHEKGSFSGAVKQHRGFFERAHGGTLFLDEVTEMSLDAQAKLLRVLESGEIRRVGAVEPMAVDVRIVAASNRDPQQAVAEQVLREDLYYRLAHVTVHVPPLRRRGGDKVGLAQYFLRQLNERHNTAIAFSEPTLSAVSDYEWPGNVRQLRHAVERAYILSDGAINAESIVPAGSGAASLSDIPIRYGMTLAESEQRIILANLEHNGGDKKETAAVLGISLKTLYNRLRDYGATEDPD